jgi:hypothetical protein
MKGIVFLAVALLILATLPVLVRCETTFLNEQFTLDNSDVQGLSYARGYYIELTRGDTIGIKLDVSGQGSTIDFKLLDSSRNTIDDQTIGTEGWQGQWTVPYDDKFAFLVGLIGGDQAAVTITLTSASHSYPIATSTGGVGVGGGFDPLPIVVGVVVVLVLLVVVFLIIRMRRRTPPPPELPPPEEMPPPPDTSYS